MQLSVAGDRVPARLWKGRIHQTQPRSSNNLRYGCMKLTTPALTSKPMSRDLGMLFLDVRHFCIQLMRTDLLQASTT
jgi:hypothetical protein